MVLNKRVLYLSDLCFIEQIWVTCTQASPTGSYLFDLRVGRMWLSSEFAWFWHWPIGIEWSWFRIKVWLIVGIKVEFRIKVWLIVGVGLGLGITLVFFVWLCVCLQFSFVIIKKFYIRTICVNYLFCYFQGYSPPHDPVDTLAPSTSEEQAQELQPSLFFEPPRGLKSYPAIFSYPLVITNIISLNGFYWFIFWRVVLNIQFFYFLQVPMSCLLWTIIVHQLIWQ